MDKYALYWLKYENIHKIKSSIKDEILMIKYYNFIFMSKIRFFSFHF